MPVPDMAMTGSDVMAMPVPDMAMTGSDVVAMPEPDLNQYTLVPAIAVPVCSLLIWT